jgi:hypothetical protein
MEIEIENEDKIRMGSSEIQKKIFWSGRRKRVDIIQSRK